MVEIVAKSLYSDETLIVTTSKTIAKIIVVNPIIMSTSRAAFPVAGTITATILTIIVMTLFVSIFVKLPFVMAPGMGFNVMLTYILVIQQKLPIPIALGVVFWSSILFFILAMSGLQKYALSAIPLSIQKALGIGLGYFLIFIGLKNANIILADKDTFVTISHMKLEYALTVIGFFNNRDIIH